MIYDLLMLLNIVNSAYRIVYLFKRQKIFPTKSKFFLVVINILVFARKKTKNLRVSQQYDQLKTKIIKNKLTNNV